MRSGMDGLRSGFFRHTRLSMCFLLCLGIRLESAGGCGFKSHVRGVRDSGVRLNWLSGPQHLQNLHNHLALRHGLALE